LEKVRENGRVISMAVLIATGVERTGEREVLGVDVGPAEDLEFWRAFLRQLVSRGLRGVRLVTSDSHLGLKQAVAEVLVGASWQRCRVHFMRNALASRAAGVRLSKTASSWRGRMSTDEVRVLVSSGRLKYGAASGMGRALRGDISTRA
jgi:hypothetical protein